MKEHPHPISQPSDDAVDEPMDTACNRRSRKRRVSLSKPELKQTSMIDVVFLLLIFFVVTANFTVEEASLLATLPGNSDPGHSILDVPVQVDMISADDGLTYSMSVNGVAVDGASELSAYMSNRVQTGLMASDDLVNIKPQGVVRWQHVLNVYNACVSAELEQVTFAQR